MDGGWEQEGAQGGPATLSYHPWGGGGTPALSRCNTGGGERFNVLSSEGHILVA